MTQGKTDATNHGHKSVVCVIRAIATNNGERSEEAKPPEHVGDHHRLIDGDDSGQQDGGGPTAEQLQQQSVGRVGLAVTPSSVTRSG